MLQILAYTYGRVSHVGLSLAMLAKHMHQGGVLRRYGLP
jgi:hypothetical protein